MLLVQITAIAHPCWRDREHVEEETINGVEILTVVTEVNNVLIHLFTLISSA